jgi:hypothetical protein
MSHILSRTEIKKEDQQAIATAAGKVYSLKLKNSGNVNFEIKFEDGTKIAVQDYIPDGVRFVLPEPRDSVLVIGKIDYQVKGKNNPFNIAKETIIPSGVQIVKKEESDIQ